MIISGHLGLKLIFAASAFIFLFKGRKQKLVLSGCHPGIRDIDGFVF